MKRKIGFLITGFLLSLPALPAQASLVRNVDLTAACDGSIPLVVYEGMGATLDFTRTDFTIQRAWLGDPSRLTLDTDIPMEEGGTSIIYLRAIERLNFDGLPSTATTVLTARIAKGSEVQLCQLPISYSSEQPQYTSLRLNDSLSLNDSNSSTQSSEVSISRLRLRLANMEHVEAGINLNAITLGEENLVVIQVRNFIQEVRDGKTQQVAAQELDIEWPLIKELERQGLVEISSRLDTISL